MSAISVKAFDAMAAISETGTAVSGGMTDARYFAIMEALHELERLEDLLLVLTVETLAQGE